MRTSTDNEASFLLTSTRNGSVLLAPCISAVDNVIDQEPFITLFLVIVVEFELYELCFWLELYELTNEII